MPGTGCLAKRSKKQAKHWIMFLKYFSKIPPVTSYFYLVYILSFASISSCGGDFHNMLDAVWKPPSLLFQTCCQILRLRVPACWGVRNILMLSLWLYGIILYPFTFCPCYFFSIYCKSLSSSFSYGSLSGTLTWVLPFSELKSSLVHLCCFGNEMSWAAYSILDVCASWISIAI